MGFAISATDRSSDRYSDGECRGADASADSLVMGEHAKGMALRRETDQTVISHQTGESNDSPLPKTDDGQCSDGLAARYAIIG